MIDQLGLHGLACECLCGCRGGGVAAEGVPNMGVVPF